jgi:hypothetical protein
MRKKRAQERRRKRAKARGVSETTDCVRAQTASYLFQLCGFTSEFFFSLGK